jgi:signal transduction histidine kinase
VVEDAGAGIASDEIPKLFQKYFRGRAAQSKPGAGLGLYLVDRIARLHGGSVGVDSDPGMGCRFVFALPGKGE